MLTRNRSDRPTCSLHAPWCFLWSELRRRRRPSRRRFWSVLVLILVVLVSTCWTSASWRRTGSSAFRVDSASSRPVRRPTAAALSASTGDPEKWLLAHSDHRHAHNTERSWSDRFTDRAWSPRPRAALISLVRNEELDGIMQSMRQLEYRWNDRYRYPWIFFNEQPFSDAFKASGSTPSAHQRTLTWDSGQPQT
jgi:hypothetical protein